MGVDPAELRARLSARVGFAEAVRAVFACAAAVAGAHGQPGGHEHGGDRLRVLQHCVELILT